MVLYFSPWGVVMYSSSAFVGGIGMRNGDAMFINSDDDWRLVISSEGLALFLFLI